MYGTYWGFNLPLSTLAALVASRPSVWPLASTTNHLRSIFLPLGTKVDISLLPSIRTYSAQGLSHRPPETKIRHSCAKHICPRKTRTGFDSTHFQTNLFG